MRTHAKSSSPVQRLFLLFALPALLLGGAGCSRRAAPAPKPDSASPALRQIVPIPDQLLRDFNDRVAKYVKVHKEQEAKLPPLKDRTDASAIAAHKTALATAIGEARKGVAAGEIFFPAIRTELTRIIRDELKGRAGATAREAIREDKPTGVPLKVNGTYAEEKSLSTMPPMLLTKLPPLPEQLEYRFVSQNLVLRDTVAGIVVDFVPGVLTTR